MSGAGHDDPFPAVACETVGVFAEFAGAVFSPVTNGPVRQFPHSDVTGAGPDRGL